MTPLGPITTLRSSGVHPRWLRRWLQSTVVELLITVALLWAVPAVVMAPVAMATAERYSVPLAPRPTVVRAFENPERRWQPGHRGVDLAGGPGVAVLAAGSGTVRFAGDVAGRTVVSIQHADGVITTYEPVRPTVADGDHVRRGQRIGTLVTGHPGCPVATCLHWGARVGAGRSARYLDPLGLIGAVRVRLKPIDEPT
ncbi:M23 family metallopeptidase [Gordonia bronchialis]|uniref:M23 family metallopeptidase n=1 Tax=Gordonia bronchialis TaxID=2054 RepID=UPI0037BE68C7|nr:M23 family metallopeptidase [Gordonia bronchialis]